MILKFLPEKHKYQSLNEKDETEWTSVTSFVSNFKQPFEADKIAVKSAKNKKSKWYGMDPEDIKAAWKSESKRAIDLGTWYHNCRESDICSLDSMNRHGKNIPVIRPVYEDGIKLSPSQKLSDGVYPEHLVYLKSAGLCGQSDLVEVVNGQVHVSDYKTNKEIKSEGYTNWEGITQKMKAPVNHLDDCNLNHYAIQLSMYMYMILKHNPRLSAGNMTIHHITFEEVGKDKYGNPITALDSHGNPVVKDILMYDVPYLKKEIISLLHWAEDNKHKTSGCLY
jgi:hypothetical protein